MHPDTQVVTFLHALGAWPSAWDQQIAGLPPGFSGRAPEIPGIKEAADTAFDFHRASADIVAGLDAEGIDRTHLCGLSLGAMVATQIALDHPDRVASLVLSGSQIAPNPALMAVQRTVVRLLPERVATRYGLAKENWLATLQAIAAVDVRTRLPEITVPTLVLCGSRDVANLPASRQLAAAVPEARLQVIRGAGHEWNLQFPDRFNSVIGDFYRQLEPSSQ